MLEHSLSLDFDLHPEIAPQKPEPLARAKHALAAKMKHELRAPLTVIIGFAEILASKQVSEEKQADYALRISKQAQSLLRVLEEIIDESQ